MSMQGKGLIKLLLDREKTAAQKCTFVVIARVTAASSSSGAPQTKDTREHGWKKSH
jgi:hypothetical protein